MQRVSYVLRIYSKSNAVIKHLGGNISSLHFVNSRHRIGRHQHPDPCPAHIFCFLSGVAFGGETGFLVGAVTMLTSNTLFSQGPWTPWQMFSMGIIGFLAGILFRKGLLRRSRGSLATFGAFAAVIIYGGIMNPASAIMYSSASLNWKILLTYYVSGLPMDLIHAAATVIFLLIAAEPMLEKLDRIKVKYGLVE